MQKEKLVLINGKEIVKTVPSKKMMNKLRQAALASRTDAELWAERIFKKEFGNDAFFVEHIFHYRRFDFYFKRQRIAVEIDGGYHYEQNQRIIDLSIDKLLLEKYRVVVLRIKNFDKEEMQEVIKKIKQLTVPELITKNITKREKREKQKLNQNNNLKKKCIKLGYIKDEPVKKEKKVILRKSSMNKIIDLLS